MTIKAAIAQVLSQYISDDAIELTVPPNAEMGNFAYACFALAKKEGQNPAELATMLASKIDTSSLDLIDDIKAFGPYVNVFVNKAAAASHILSTITAAGEQFGTHDIGKGKTYMVEYGCPNPLKAFHLGHLKNLITGEAIARLFEVGGYTITRVNYQGDVGMHIAKALWGIYDWKDQFDALDAVSVREKAEFLGKAYAHGAQHFESSEEGKQEVIAYNDKVYERDASIWDVYTKARQWSLDYFNSIYAKLDTCYDEFYFESEMYERAVELVNEYTEKGVFAESEGAIIFPGGEYGLHDRVFINSKGFPTYEAKDIALSEKRFTTAHPDAVIHVVGKEQTEYFKVVFKALSMILPETEGKEIHIPGGFLQLKGDQKMSSRTGNIVTGDALLELVESRVEGIMKDYDRGEKEMVVSRVTAAALKYSMLKADIRKDIQFDINESISTSGDSGPYLLYIIARMNSMFAKAGEWSWDGTLPEHIHDQTNMLLAMMDTYPEITKQALDAIDPSIIARYLFSLAKQFNAFYDACDVLQADEQTKAFRLHILTQLRDIMVHGLHILGITPVEQM